MTKSDQSFTLNPGAPTTIKNPSAANLRFEIETAGGTRLEIPVPSGFEFKVIAGTDVMHAKLVIVDAPGFGPRAVE